MVELSDRWVGHVDRYDTNGAYGWAADQADLHRCVRLEVVDETGRQFAHCVADSFREDLAQQGFGHGKHGFFLPFDRRIRSVGIAYIRFCENQVLLHRGVIDLDVETMMFTSPMPDQYIVLMRSLAHKIRQTARDDVPVGTA